MAPRTVLVVRHAQSAANVGQRTRDPASIAITDLGRAQAERLAASVGFAPTRIITSSFVRTHQTAEPLMLRFQQLVREEWNIHELTYLSPSRFVDSSPEERRPFVDEFWRAADPHRVDGDGAESIAQFVGRVSAALTSMRDEIASDSIVVTHGQVMQTMLYLLGGHPIPSTRAQTIDYRKITTGTPIANTAVLPLRIDDEIHAEAISLAHLSTTMITY